MTNWNKEAKDKMNIIEQLVEKFYVDFAGLPNLKPVVRNNIREDAFTLVILKIMYSHNLKIEITPENIDKITQIVVAPPDSGIDMIIEIEDGDEYYYDIIQAKYSELTEEEIRTCFLGMKDAVKRYLKNPNDVQSNLKDVLQETNFSTAFKSNITYYVFHKGTLNYGKSFKPNEKIVTSNEMEIIYESLTENGDTILKVPYAEFSSDMFNNYILYENAFDDALLCNIRGYDLAELCNKYISSSMGRNILFGQNLRDSLGEKKSKTYNAMVETIDNEPERFWNYNNGITIICEELDADKKEDNGIVDLIKIRNFSIINGAQTTSALGAYLKEAILSQNKQKIEQLKKVYVLVRIMQVKNESLRGNISIYNNLQNPISSRDMVANNYEQNELHKKLKTGEIPHIFMEIRRGQYIPPQPRFEKHQQTSNEDIAQVAAAAFLIEPFKAKDKKKTLFNKANACEEYIVNEYYDEIFYLSKTDDKKGVLFQKTKREIDEALFIKYLYQQARNKMRKIYDNRIIDSNEKIKANLGNKEHLEKMLELHQRNKEVNNTCMFYCVALYFSLKQNFGTVGTENIFDYYKFYRDNRNSTYKQDIIKFFADNFLQETVKIISGLLKNSGSGSATNWLKKPQSQKEFFDALYENMANDMRYQEMYDEFIELFTI